ncbi:ParB family chromosome partitioning protein [Deinococcus soli (ex Cha et al. 2016)]|uniref:ParB family chromosome partitioning protein n=1 Tax=Deinococcus soli (ex Cha et al. 2016) TaxID=1309411 RepID=A0AAE3XDP6_9DEIO|nr:ParB/RepB/Spo0J family partition protein [Deinococcus soli (ex Cha et al. 2016)]MDR6220035.1 ParB family chromosome partitioning protein [Deinococcus soli (ex Cha et al. 2016)]
MTQTKARGLPHVSGLATGLSALTELTDKAAHRLVDIQQVHVNPDFNPRGRFDPDAFNEDRLAALSSSIRKEGVLSPLWVRPRPEGGYALIAGERRWRAAQLADLKKVPVLIFEADDRRAAYLAVVENAQREDLSIVDETFAGFGLLSAHTGLTVPEVIGRLNQVRKGAEDTLELEAFLRGTYGTGVSVWSQHRARILEFTPEELSAIQERRLDVSVVYELVPLKAREERSVFLQRAVQEGLNATQIRELVRPLLARPTSPGLKAEVSALRSTLPRLARLKGDAAERARQLIRELQDLIEQQ